MSKKELGYTIAYVEKERKKTKFPPEANNTVRIDRDYLKVLVDKEPIITIPAEDGAKAVETKNENGKGKED